MSATLLRSVLTQLPLEAPIEAVNMFNKPLIIALGALLPSAAQKQKQSLKTPTKLCRLLPESDEQSFPTELPSYIFWHNALAKLWDLLIVCRHNNIKRCKCISCAASRFPAWMVGQKLTIHGFR